MATVMNRYHREYYVTRDQRVRATIDTCQQVFDQRYSSIPNILRPRNIPDTVIIEFKFDRNDRDLASDIIQGFPVRVNRNSKYMIGLKSMQNS